MPIVIATAQVEDIEKWETGFRTHIDLFQKQGIKSPILFATNTDSHSVTIQFDVEDLDHYMEVLHSEETAEAMQYDGIKRETVKATVLDQSVIY